MAVSNLCEGVAGKYLTRLSNDLGIIPSENGCHLLTPFIRPDGEAIGLEITALGNESFRLSDMGDTLGYLYVNGLTADLAVPDYTRSIARLYGASFDGNALIIDSCSDALGDAVHNIIQSVLSVTSFAQGRSSKTPALVDNGKNP